jgi:hypothetical protein
MKMAENAWWNMANMIKTHTDLENRRKADKLLIMTFA